MTPHQYFMAGSFLSDLAAFFKQRTFIEPKYSTQFSQKRHSPGYSVSLCYMSLRHKLTIKYSQHSFGKTHN